MDELPETEEADEKSANIIRQKISFVGKLSKMQRVLREESEIILKIKAMNDNKLPKGILLGGKEALQSFFKVKQEDMKNEARPY
jgi:serine/threonine-protein phosphatase 2B catalytic subunit